MPLAYPNWPARSLFQRSSIIPPTPVDFLLLFIPSNPFHALANAIVPAVVVFSILIGLALTGIAKKDVIIEPLSVLGEILTKITGYVSKLAPIGVFSLVGGAAGTMSFTDLSRLQVYIVILVFFTLIMVLWLMPALVATLTPLRYRDIVRELRTPLITGFATGSSLVVLPLLAEACKRLVAAHLTDSRTSDRTEEKSSVDVLIPTFYSFPTVGNVLSLGFVVFSGWYVGTPLSPADLYTLLSGGVASLFGGTALAIPFSLGLVNLPSELFNVFVSIDFIGSRLSTSMSVMHYATIALIGTCALQGLTVFRPLKVLTLQLLSPPRPNVVYTEVPSAPQDGGSPPRTFAEIVSSGVLKVCYLPGNYPLSFFNSRGDLVGFDIEMAHKFAERLNLAVEFLPLELLRNGPARLASGYCDVVFNSTAKALNRMGAAAETDPIGVRTIAFIVPERLRNRFDTWERVRRLGPIEVATSAFQILPRAVLTRIPKAAVVSLETLEEQKKHFAGDGSGADAFLDTAEEGAAWARLYPRFTVVVPRPVLQVPVIYLVGQDRPVLLRALNAWLLIEKQTGGVNKLEDYWIEGKTDQTGRPRWSVIRDVLKWVD
jgi:ABC-type amino acid transport substrate-binding protein